MEKPHFDYVAQFVDLKTTGCKAIRAGRHTIVLCFHENRVFAVDNRCPHMEFPLDQGTVRNGTLTCHWHHARFDLESGDTFNQSADEVRTFPVEFRNGEIWVDISIKGDPRHHQRERLQVGYEGD